MAVMTSIRFRGSTTITLRAYDFGNEDSASQPHIIQRISSNLKSRFTDENWVLTEIRQIEVKVFKCHESLDLLADIETFLKAENGKLMYLDEFRDAWAIIGQGTLEVNDTIEEKEFYLFSFTFYIVVG